jgi:hypothetical protein
LLFTSAFVFNVPMKADWRMAGKDYSPGRHGNVEAMQWERSSKSQTPNPKQTLNTKSQTPKHAPWSLDLGICLGFGVWDLGFAPRLGDVEATNEPCFTR